MKLEIHCQCLTFNPLVASQPRRSKQRLGHRSLMGSESSGGMFLEALRKGMGVAS